MLGGDQLGPLSTSRYVGRLLACIIPVAAVVSALASILGHEYWTVLLPIIAVVAWVCLGYRYLQQAVINGNSLTVSRWPLQSQSIAREDIVDAGYRRVLSVQLPELMVLQLADQRRVVLWGSWGTPAECDRLECLLQSWRVDGAN
jgi:hypothetical protein